MAKQLKGLEAEFEAQPASPIERITEVVNNKIFMINENEDRLLIFKIDNNGKITDIEEHINNWFDFSNITEAIIIDGWEQYLFI